MSPWLETVLLANGAGEASGPLLSWKVLRHIVNSSLVDQVSMATHVIYAPYQYNVVNLVPSWLLRTEDGGELDQLSNGGDLASLPNILMPDDCLLWSVSTCDMRGT